MCFCVTVGQIMSAMRAAHGRILLSRLSVPTIFALLLPNSLRRAITAIVGLVSPSAASTQVVPNGGKGRRDSYFLQHGVLIRLRFAQILGCRLGRKSLLFLLSDSY